MERAASKPQRAMAHQQGRQRRHRNEASEPPALPPRPIELLHPILLYLLRRMEITPPGSLANLSETELAHAVSLAISLAPDEEQTYLVSRIMTDEEIAQEHLQSAEMQNLNHNVHLSEDEKRILRRASPEPETNGDEEEEDDNNNNNNPCLVCSSKSEVSVPCGCRYCLHCLRVCIRTGLHSEAAFPPRCCRPLDETTIRQAERPGLVRLFRQLSAEYAIPAVERLHCHDASCASFIPRDRIEEPDGTDDEAAVGTCPACKRETCAECGGRVHRGLPCREEEDEEVLWDMMDEQGLVHCPGCGMVMALREGCNHMTCPCGTEFCFLCGRQWRTCSCPPYGGFHLRVPVHERPGRRPIPRGGRAHLAQQTEHVYRLPQLRYDPDDEVALAAVEDLVPPDIGAVEDDGLWENPEDFETGVNIPPQEERAPGLVIREHPQLDWAAERAARDHHHHEGHHPRQLHELNREELLHLSRQLQYLERDPGLLMAHDPGLRNALQQQFPEHPMPRIPHIAVPQPQLQAFQRDPPTGWMDHRVNQREGNRAQVAQHHHHRTVPTARAALPHQEDVVPRFLDIDRILPRGNDWAELLEGTLLPWEGFDHRNRIQPQVDAMVPDNHSVNRLFERDPRHEPQHHHQRRNHTADAPQARRRHRSADRADAPHRPRNARAREREGERPMPEQSNTGGGQREHAGDAAQPFLGFFLGVFGDELRRQSRSWSQRR